MGSFYDAVATRDPVLDQGWRVSLFPPGTTYEQALAQEILIQGESGRVLDPATAELLTTYWVRGTADYLPDTQLGECPDDEPDRGWRDVVADLGTVVLRYRMSGPGLHV